MYIMLNNGVHRDVICRVVSRLSISATVSPFLTTEARSVIHKLIHKALTLPDGNQLRHAVDRLHCISQGNCGTERTRITVEEFLRTVSYYRSYLTDPSLGLPHTTNTVESMCRLIREMFRSSRAGSNPDSVLLWAIALHTTPAKGRLQRTSSQQISFTHPENVRLRRNAAVMARSKGQFRSSKYAIKHR
jgi:hypothetical protein